MEHSPFVFQQPLAPDQVHGRDAELAVIVREVTAGNAVTVSGPRRFGKTSMLSAARARLADDGHPAVLADLYGTASVAELTIRLERAWTRVLPRWRRIADTALEATRLGLSLGGAGISATFQRSPRTDPLPALHALLALPEQLGSPQRRAIVILDEFQAVADLPGVEGLLRSHFQHHRDYAGYVFAGSEAHLLDRQFTDPDRPFFGQVLRVRIGRMTRADLAAAVSDGFARTERAAGPALDALLALSDGHPQRAMLLAHFLWHETGEGAVADLETWAVALDTARSHVQPEVEARFDRCTRNQQRLVRALARGLSPFTVSAQAALGLERGSVSKTLASAVRDGLVEQTAAPQRSPDAATYGLVDPLLGDWLRGRFP